MLDTNIIIASLSSFSKFHWIIKSLVNSDYLLLVTTEILFEYEEKIEGKVKRRLRRSFHF